MRALSEGFFERSPLMAAPLVAMLFFLVVFIAVVARVVRTPRVDADRSARLPLGEREGADV